MLSKALGVAFFDFFLASFYMEAELVHKHKAFLAADNLAVWITNQDFFYRSRMVRLHMIDYEIIQVCPVQHFFYIL